MLLLQYTSRRAKHATLRAMSPERAHMTSLSRSNAQWRGQPPAGHAAASVHSLAGAVAQRAEARARVGFGPGGLAVLWRSFVQVAGRRRTPSARRPRLAREGRGPVTAASAPVRLSRLARACPSVRSCRMRLGLQWGQVASGVLTARAAPAASGRRAHRGY